VEAEKMISHTSNKVVT